MRPGKAIQLMVNSTLLLFASVGFHCSKSGTSAGDISVRHVWTRPVHAYIDSTGKALSNGALYLTIQNTGSTADTLEGVSAAVCQVSEIHQSKMVQGRMTMNMLPSGLPIPAYGEIKFEPGSYHVMLIGIKRDLNAGDTFEAQLHFRRAGTLSVQSQIGTP